MARDKQESVSLSPETLEFVAGLQKLRTYGGKSRSGVLRFLIEYAIREMLRDDIVNREIATRKAIGEL